MPEPAPPWIAFPYLAAYDPPTQGTEEAYIDRGWLPFWLTLDEAGQAAYLDRWQASAEWREVISERYGRRNFDVEEDARDAAAWWSEQRPSKSRSPLCRWLRGG